MNARAGGDLRARVAALARQGAGSAPVVSAYLATRWGDEHQRDRVRIFLKNAVAQARRGDPRPAEADLDWVLRTGQDLVDQARPAESPAVALFAGGAAGLREMLPLGAPVDNAFHVGPAPYLAPLAGVLGDLGGVLVVFVDTAHARLLPLGPDGPGEEVTLQGEVPGHHRRGGWAQLAQSRYQRHIQDHRGRHFEAVAEAVRQVAESQAVEHIVLAGEPRATAAFRDHLPPALGALVRGVVPGTPWEPAAAIVERARDLLGLVRRSALGATVDQVLTEAAKGGQAVAGVEPVLDAVSRGAVQRLFVWRDARIPGRQCESCGGLAPGDGAGCRLCGGATRPAELVEALVARVLATGGLADRVETHLGLQRLGGLAATLRYRP
jgi:hypothetical protein